MKRIRIRVMKMARYEDLMAEYENPMEHACDMRLGQEFIAEGWQRPEGFCESAWESLSPFVMTLAHGGENFYDGWMKEQEIGDDFLQRRFPTGILLCGSAGRGCAGFEIRGAASEASEEQNPDKGQGLYRYRMGDFDRRCFFFRLCANADLRNRQH